MGITYEIACQKSDKVSVDKKVLELLSTTKGFVKINDDIATSIRLSAKQFLLIGRHLGMSEASIRMALSRQTKNGKLERNSGLYSLVSQNQPFSLPRFWLDIESRLTYWHGDWFLVNLTANKVNATKGRNLNRKANLLGLVFVAGLGWLRPNNLANLKDEVSYHFKSVLENDNFITANLSDLDQAWKNNLADRWPIKQLNEFYDDSIISLKNERLRLNNASTEEIVMRSFTFGRYLIELLSCDPWLPSQLLNTQSRQDLFNEAKAYYLQITPFWAELLDVK